MKINKQIIKAVSLTLLILSLLALSACKGEQTSGESDAVSTEEVTSADTAVDTALSNPADTGCIPDTTPDDFVATPVSQLEKVSEDIRGLLDAGEISIIECNALLRCAYEKDGVHYNWNSFFNACVDGKIDYSEDGLYDFAVRSLETFNSLGMETQCTQAKNIIAEIKGATGK